MQETPGVCSSQNQHSSFVFDVLIGEKFPVESRIGDNERVSIDHQVKIAKPVEELYGVPSVVEQIG